MNTKRVSYEGKEIFVGVDVHKRSYSVTVVCEGEVVKRWRMVAEPLELVEALGRNFPGGRYRSVYEAGFSGFVLHRVLEQAGISNIVVNPAAIEVAAGDRVKTDKRDATKLATQLSVGRLRGIKIPSKEQELARQLSRTREQLVRIRSRLMTQFRMKCFQFGIWQPKIMTTTRAAQMLPELPAELEISLRALLTVWMSVNEQIKETDGRLREQAKNDQRESVYRSIPGVGAVTARVLSNELGNMSQFPNEGALFSFVGLTPQEFSSGDKRRLGHISRQGSARLRGILVEAAWVSITKDPSLRKDFLRIAARAGKKRAIVAIARKLIGRARALFRKNTLYELQAA